MVFALPSPEIPYKQSLVKKVQQIVEEVAEGLDVQVKVTEMDAEQRVKFSALALEAQPAAHSGIPKPE